MTRRGTTILETLIAATLALMLAGAGVSGLAVLARRTERASSMLADETQALRLLEQVRLELSSMVLHPSWNAAAHEGNTFLVSKPNGSSIQFVMERMDRGLPVRHLVYYEARRRAGELSIVRTAWRFHRYSQWNETITFPAGWPADWVGPVVERREYRFRELSLEDVQWLYLVPDDGEGRVYFRVRILLRPRHGGAPVPLTTLVGVGTPELSAEVVDCPCLFSDRFDPANPDCHACTDGPR